MPRGNSHRASFCVMQFCLLGLAQAVVHGSEHGLAGQGRAGNSIHAVGGTGLGQGICQGLGSSAAQLRGLAGSINGHFAHLAAGNSHGDLHIAQAALSAGSIGAVGQVLCACRAGAGLRQAAVHGGEHSIAGEGRAGNGVHALGCAGLQNGGDDLTALVEVRGRLAVMAHHRDVGKDTVGNGHLQGDGAAKTLGRGGVHAVAVGGRRGEFFFHRRCGGRRLRRQRVIDHLAGQRVFDGTQNAPGSISGFRHRVHLPGLGVQHGVQQPLCSAQEGAGLVGGAQHLHIGDVPALHGHLPLHGAAEAPGGAGVDAVGIGQHGGQALGFFFRGCGGLCGRLMCCLSYESDYYAEAYKKVPKLGAEVVYPERDMAIRLASRLETSRTLDFVQLSERINVSKIQIPEKAVGMSVLQVDFRSRFGLNIIAIEHNGVVIEIVTPDYIFQRNDILFLAGSKEGLLKLDHWAAE